jgi:hypothetical protein
MEKNTANIVKYIQKGQNPLDLAKELNNPDVLLIMEEWTLRRSTLRSATLKIVDI